MGPLLKKTLYSYATLDKIKSFAQTVIVQDGSGNQVAKTTSNYDETNPGLVATSGVPQHFNPPGTSRGNLASVQRWLNTTGGLVSSSTRYYDTGVPYTTTDPNHYGGTATTTYTYSSSFGSAYPTRVADPFGFKGTGFWCSLRSMANKLIRHYGRGHLHFITFTCYRRLPLLRSVRARNIFVHILGEVRDRYGFSLVGYVVMPEHIHLLMSEPAKGNPSVVLQVLKQRVSRRLRHKKRAPTDQLTLNFAIGDDSLPRFWQRRFYDFNVWSLKKRVEKLHYMHMNPLKRKLVDHPKDWPWSSFSFYSKLKHGLIRVDSVK